MIIIISYYVDMMNEPKNSQAIERTEKIKAELERIQIEADKIGIRMDASGAIGDCCEAIQYLGRESK